MRKLIWILMFAPALAIGSAQAETDSWDVTCGQATNMVEDYGSVVFNTGENRFVRLVDSLNYCAEDETLKKHWISTADANNCAAGFRCAHKGPTATGDEASSAGDLQ